MQAGARILRFPAQTAPLTLSPSEAQLAARDYLTVPPEERSVEHRHAFLSSPDILLAICSLLRERRDVSPATVLKDAVEIYQWLCRPECDLGLFDEKDYFIGEMALIAGGVSRNLGYREEAFLWLDRAEAGFRHTMNPAPGLANVAYARLALRYEMGRYEDVLELTPSLEASFRKLRMEIEAAKCRLLFASTLKVKGDTSAALEALIGLEGSPILRTAPSLRASILSEIGDLRQLNGDFQSAIAAFEEAASLLSNTDPSPMSANLKFFVGAAYRAYGRLEQAVAAYRVGREEFRTLGLRAQVAYGHILAAEVLLDMKRDREAQWEILAALPEIDEIGMVPEAIAAVALLKESVQRSKTDPATLLKVRSYLEGAS